MLTLKKVNDAIKAAGIKAELVKGKGYFYFVGSEVRDDADGVYVYSLNELDLARWIEEARDAVN